jgi:hypothetical protein
LDGLVKPLPGSTLLPNMLTDADIKIYFNKHASKTGYSGNYSDFILEFEQYYYGSFDFFYEGNNPRRSLGRSPSINLSALKGCFDDIHFGCSKGRTFKGRRLQWLENYGNKTLIHEFSKQYFGNTFSGTWKLPSRARSLSISPSSKPPLDFEFQFDYILIDEFQDLYRTDFCLLYHLLKRKKGQKPSIGLYGDIAQAVQLGSKLASITTRIPKEKRNILELGESYRLPRNLVESLQPLHEKIFCLSKLSAKKYSCDVKKVSLSAVKHALPGARLIFVYGKDVAALTDKIYRVVKTFSVYNPKRWGDRNTDFPEIKIMEADKDLAHALELKCGTKKVKASTILREKGLEFDCVIWSARKPILRNVMEGVYTILSRATTLGIVALTEDGSETPDLQNIMTLLKNGNMQVYDAESESKLEGIILDSEMLKSNLETQLDDDDNYEEIPD